MFFDYYGTLKWCSCENRHRCIVSESVASNSPDAVDALHKGYLRDACELEP